MAGKINTGKKYRKPYQKPSDTFWHDSFMKVLLCLEHEELTWSMDNWQKYGVSIANQKRIKQEFLRWQRLPRVTVSDGKIFDGNGEMIGARG